MTVAEAVDTTQAKLNVKSLAAVVEAAVSRSPPAVSIVEVESSFELLVSILSGSA